MEHDGNDKEDRPGRRLTPLPPFPNQQQRAAEGNGAGLIQLEALFVPLAEASKAQAEAERDAEIARVQSVERVTLEDLSLQRERGRQAHQNRLISLVAVIVFLGFAAWVFVFVDKTTGIYLLSHAFVGAGGYGIGRTATKKASSKPGESDID